MTVVEVEVRKVVVMLFDTSVDDCHMLGIEFYLGSITTVVVM